MKKLIPILGVAFVTGACSPNNFEFARSSSTGTEGDNGGPQFRYENHDYSVTLGQITNKVDVLFVVDNSGSMSEEQANMSTRFPNFIESLAGYDWRIGVTTTDINREQGKLIPLKQAAAPLPSQVFDPVTIMNGNLPDLNYVLVSGASEASTVFRETVQIGSNGSGDERGIFAANLALDANPGLNFLRNDSHLAVVIISDEDERSNGQNLADFDMPATLVSRVKGKFGETKSLTVHSIITRPGDQACLDGPGQSFGELYKQVSNLTGGLLGDICAPDYGAQLKLIGKSIQEQSQSIGLKCEPVAGSLVAEFQPALASPVQLTLVANKVRFDPAPPAGSVLKLKYTCAIQIN